MKKSSFSRRGPDRMMEELAGVLSSGTPYEFKPLFTVVHENLKAQNAAAGGEEMLRLRAYEKLQSLVRTGAVTKTGREYTGVANSLAKLLATTADLNSKAEEAAAEKKAARQAKTEVEAEAAKPAPAVKKRVKAAAAVSGA